MSAGMELQAIGLAMRRLRLRLQNTRNWWIGCAVQMSQTGPKSEGSRGPSIRGIHSKTNKNEQNN
eukprot:6344179-Amphidinium_carterae.1